jgi:hypothetical protein
VNEVTTEGRPWGMCYCYGCPLLGTVGHSAGDGKWYCFCHLNMPSDKNDAITMKLNSPDLDFIVRTTLEIRSVGSSFYDHPNLYRRIQERLTLADRKDLLFNADGKDTPPVLPHGRKVGPTVKMWLARLEGILMDATKGALGPGHYPLTVPTAPVIGPTHASRHHPYAQGD